MKNKISIVSFFITALAISACNITPKLPKEVLDNYKKYDSSYSSSSFKVSKIASLKGRDDFIFGADISLSSAIEESGSYYYNNQNQKEDICKILIDSGINTVRIRLFHNYQSPDGTKGGKLNLPRVISMIRQAKQYDLKVLLDLHYSDCWADPGHQLVPNAWKNASFEGILNNFYTYTKDVLSTIKKENLSIDFIQIGNEIDNGIIHPYGEIDWNNRDSSFDKVAQILAEGSKASREEFPDCKIIIHTANGAKGYGSDTNIQNSEMFFYKALEERHLDYDIIGASYYAFMDTSPIDWISTIIDNYKKEINKPVMIVETSYAYTYAWNDYTSNIFYTDKALPEYPVSYQGQTNIILDIINQVASAKNNNGLGVCYWGGEFIPNKDPDMRTTWANQALFTYEGIATPTLSLFKKCR